PPSVAAVRRSLAPSRLSRTPLPPTRARRASCPLFFLNYPATTEIYTLSLHDALPIWPAARRRRSGRVTTELSGRRRRQIRQGPRDRKSTRLNSSHGSISYAVFCLKKKKMTDES